VVDVDGNYGPQRAERCDGDDCANTRVSTGELDADGGAVGKPDHADGTGQAPALLEMIEECA